MSSREPTEQSSSSILGTLIAGKWRVQRVLGEGGTATVYFAVHEHTRHRAAIKVLHPEHCRVPEARVRFAREARAANSVNHRGALPVLDDGELADGTPYLVMDYLEGYSVQTRLQEDGPLSVNEVLSIIECLLDVLETAHDVGVLHRDIKPDNIYLTSEGEVKLLDFGISKLAEETVDHKTQVGVAMGTPAYMAPEQARGRWDQIDARTEIFSVGATMFTMLTGRVVHTAETNNELLLEAMTKPATRIRDVAPDVPVGVAEVVDRSLAFEKENRFATARQMRAAVSVLVGDETRQSQPSFSGAETRSSLPTSPDEVPARTTYRPVMFSLLPDTTLVQKLRSSRRNWALAAAVVGVSVISYLLVSSGSDDAQIHSPVSASHTPSTGDLEPDQAMPKEPVDDGQVFELDDLPEAEIDEPSRETAAAPTPGDHRTKRTTTAARPSSFAPGGPTRPSDKTQGRPSPAVGDAQDPIKDTDPLSRRR